MYNALARDYQLKLRGRSECGEESLSESQFSGRTVTGLKTRLLWKLSRWLGKGYVFARESVER